MNYRQQSAGGGGKNGTGQGKYKTGVHNFINTDMHGIKESGMRHATMRQGNNETGNNGME